MKSVQNFLFTFLLTVFGCISAEAMVNVQSEPHFVDRKPLAEWSIVHPFNSQEEMDFYSNETWHPDLTLEQNQKELIRNFVEECCDFSFKIKPIKLRGVILGFLDSGEFLVFGNESISANADKDGINMTIYDDNYKDDGGLSTPCTTPSFIGYRPVGECMKYKNQFIEYFSKMAEDPVGCKLFRVVLTKHVVNDLDKIVFIPAVPYEDDGQSDITCNSGYSICYHLARQGNTVAKKYLEQDQPYRFITFSPKFLEEPLLVGVIKYVNNKISFEIVEFLREAALFHEIVHSLHSDIPKKLCESKNIRKRSLPIVLKCTLKDKNKTLYARGENINVGLFHNDEEYHTIYGITEEGLDLLNESSFSAHKCGFIRASHGDIQESKLFIEKINLKKEKVIEFYQKFFEKYGDHDLFHYYLAPDSPIKYPKFGVGQYRCADLDPNTGEKS